MNTTENPQLRAANKCITALRKELQLVGDASELFDAQAVMPPKDARPKPTQGENLVDVRRRFLRGKLDAPIKE